jgi:hypothetical protein
LSEPRVAARKAFRVKKQDRTRLEKRKRRMRRRLAPRNWSDQARPMFRGTGVRYEVADKARAVRAGGVAAVHALAKRTGLVKALDRALVLLKRHLPYHESDHVLNLAYNIVAGHECIEDLELLRNDEAYTDMLGAQRIPDPTTAGDFLRRFAREDILALMETVNDVRAKLWARQPEEFLERAFLDVDGTLAPTDGEKKEGMALSYNGIWGYHPLIVSLANSKEPLYIVNRPGSVPSHEDAAWWIDRAVARCRGIFRSVALRGDTDFSLTAHFDRWTEEGVRFYFGYDAHENLRETADSLPDSAWAVLKRPPGYTVRTEPREKRENVKERVVEENGYKNVRLVDEEIAEFEYRPGKCQRSYRMVVVRKNLSVERGGTWLWDDWRYFFYVTNDATASAEEVVAQAMRRCDQENLIEQLKNGVHALRVPVYDLVSNWAYMVIASLAWTLKAWFGLTQPRAADRAEVLAMEFKRFLHAVVLVPCQVVRSARRITLRLLAYTDKVRLLFASLKATARLSFT